MSGNENGLTFPGVALSLPVSRAALSHLRCPWGSVGWWALAMWAPDARPLVPLPATHGTTGPAAAAATSADPLLALPEHTHGADDVVNALGHSAWFTAWFPPHVPAPHTHILAGPPLPAECGAALGWNTCIASAPAAEHWLGLGAAAAAGGGQAGAGTGDAVAALCASQTSFPCWPLIPVPLRLGACRAGAARLAPSSWSASTSASSASRREEAKAAHGIESVCTAHHVVTYAGTARSNEVAPSTSGAANTHEVAHMRAPVSRPPPTLASVPLGKLHVCLICGRQLGSRTSLARHKKAPNCSFTSSVSL